MQCFHKFDRFLFHVDDQGVDPIAVIAIADQGGNSHGQARRRRDQGFGDTTGEDGRIADAVGRYCREYLNHANDGPEESEQRRYRRNGAERVEVAFEFMNDMTTGILDAVLHDGSLAIPVDEAGSEYLSQRGALVQGLNLILVELVFFDPAPHLAGQVFGYDSLFLQGPKSLENDARCDDRAKDDRHHQPAAGFNDFNHIS